MGSSRFESCSCAISGNRIGLFPNSEEPVPIVRDGAEAMRKELVATWKEEGIVLLSERRGWDFW